ncbi:MAG: hypothetical protein LBQ79_05905, partial [Deltaproteobacteria bacterium]|nr:hypothetical protein [Deltaproteobacteria bacterium]
MLSVRLEPHADGQEDPVLIMRDSIQITQAQYKKHWLWLKEVDGMALCNVLLNREEAFRDFFRNPGHFGFPKYKSRHRDRNSYTTSLIRKNIELREDGKL